MKLKFEDLNITKDGYLYKVFLRNTMRNEMTNYDVKGSITVAMSINARKELDEAPKAKISGEGFFSVIMVNTIPTPILMITKITGVEKEEEK